MKILPLFWHIFECGDLEEGKEEQGRGFDSIGHGFRVEFSLPTSHRKVRGNFFRDRI